MAISRLWGKMPFNQGVQSYSSEKQSQMSARYRARLPHSKARQEVGRGDTLSERFYGELSGAAEGLPVLVGGECVVDMARKRLRVGKLFSTALLAVRGPLARCSLGTLAE